jgi:hypothetical protein
MGNQEVEYRELISLLERLHRISIVSEAIANEDELLHNAELAMADKKGPQTLTNLEHNLHNARTRILSEVRGVLQSFEQNA